MLAAGGYVKYARTKKMVEVIHQYRLSILVILNIEKRNAGIPAPKDGQAANNIMPGAKTIGTALNMLDSKDLIPLFLK